MIQRFLTACLFGTVFFGTPYDGSGSSSVPPENVGVAALDARSGEVLWEAWAPEQVPLAHRNHARILLGDWWDHFLADSSEVDRRLRFESNSSRDQLKLALTRGGLSRDEPLATARFDHVRSNPNCHSESHYCLVSNGTLHAMLKRPPGPGQPWTPAWSIKLAPENSETRWTIQAGYDLVWVAGNNRILVIHENGEKLSDEVVEGGEWARISFEEDLAFVRFPAQLRVYDRFSGEFRWALPCNPDRKFSGFELFPVFDRGLVFFKTPLLDIPENVPAGELSIVAVDRLTGEVIWTAAAADEAPGAYRGFVSRELAGGPFRFVSRSHDPDHPFGPDSFLREADSQLRFQVYRDRHLRKHPRWGDYVGLLRDRVASGYLGIPIVRSPQPGIRSWQESLNHLFVYSDDRKIRCFTRHLPNEGESWDPLWEIEFGHEGVVMREREEGMWIIGKGRVVCLDPRGELLKDIAGPEHLSFTADLWGNPEPIVQFDEDLIFLSGGTTAALDRKTGEVLWNFTNGIMGEWKFEVLRSADREIAFVPVSGYLTSGILQLLGSDPGWPFTPPQEIPVDSTKRSEWAVSMAEMARAYGDRYVQRRLARGQFVKEGLSAAALAEIARIAAASWPSARSKSSLAEFCLEKIEGMNPPAEGPNPRLVYWAAIAETPPIRDPGSRDRLADACIRALESGPASERDVVEWILLDQCGGSERIDSHLMERLFAGRGKVMQWYFHQGDYEQAAKLLRESSSDSSRKAMLFRFYDLSRTVEPGPQELLLLDEQMKQHPAATARAVYPWFRSRPARLPKSFVEILRQFVTREAESQGKSGGPASGNRFSDEFPAEAVALLHWAGNADDSVLFRKLLHHPLFADSRQLRVQEGKRHRVEIREFIVRQAAAEALRERGESIPESVQLVQENGAAS